MALRIGVEEYGPGHCDGPIYEERIMAAQARRTNSIPFLGPFAAVGMIFGTWAALGFFESCISLWPAPTFYCKHSVLFYSLYASGTTVLAGLLGWVTCVLYHSVSPLPTKTSELPSALRFNFLMGVVSYGLIRWNLHAPDIDKPFFFWIGVTLLACGILLILINHFSRERDQS
ncbi:MAG: hypothetical protein ACPGYT_13740 [Nitrospirales bacterium]